MLTKRKRLKAKVLWAWANGVSVAIKPTWHLGTECWLVFEQNNSQKDWVLLYDRKKKNYHRRKMRGDRWTHPRSPREKKQIMKIVDTYEILDTYIYDRSPVHRR